MYYSDMIFSMVVAEKGRVSQTPVDFSLPVTEYFFQVADKSVETKRLYLLIINTPELSHFWLLCHLKFEIFKRYVFRHLQDWETRTFHWILKTVICFLGQDLTFKLLFMLI